MNNRPTPETEACMEFFGFTDDPEHGGASYVNYEFAAKLERERDEARHKLELCMAANSDVARIAKERDEEQKKLSSIHHWIERNHPDGFIDSLTHLQNLDRVIDNWYERFDRLEVDACRFEKERDEAMEVLRQIKASDWKTSGELRGMARIFLDGIK